MTKEKELQAQLASSSVPAQLTNYVSELQNYLTAATPTLARKNADANALKAQLAAALRPGYDQAIDTRRQQTVTNKANIDADAAARGMGASTYVTDVKNRQQNAEAKDVSALEGDYSAALASALMQQMNADDQYNLSVDQFNASAKANALQNALSLGTDLYGQYLADSKKSTRSTKAALSDDWEALVIEAGTGANGAEFSPQKAQSRIGNVSSGYSKAAIARAQQELAKVREENARVYHK